MLIKRLKELGRGEKEEEEGESGVKDGVDDSGRKLEEREIKGGRE